MPSHKIQRSYTDSTGVQVTKTETITNNTEKSFEAVLPVAVDTHYVIALTRTLLKSIMIFSDQDATLCTNAASTGSPEETIALQGGFPIIWSLLQDGLAACPFSGNITAFYLTRATSTANFKFKAIAVDQ